MLGVAKWTATRLGSLLWNPRIWHVFSCREQMTEQNLGERRKMSIFPTRILVATDSSEEASLAGEAAADIAQKTNSELHVVHVGPLVGYIAAGTPLITNVHDHYQEEVSKVAQNLLDAQVHHIEDAGSEVEQTHLMIGQPDEEIIELAEDIGAGLIVMGSRGLGGIRRGLMGSVSESVVRHAHCPVLVVRH
jgi:nucleotide-binding universal stress UspA family protein